MKEHNNDRNDFLNHLNVLKKRLQLKFDFDLKDVKLFLKSIGKDWNGLLLYNHEVQKATLDDFVLPNIRLIFDNSGRDIVESVSVRNETFSIIEKGVGVVDYSKQWKQFLHNKNKQESVTC